LISLLFFFYWLVDHPDLHSFPTRRSSDLQMMGVPAEDRPYVRQLAEKLLYIGRGEHDRMPILTEGMKGMVEYVSPLVDERMVRPGDDFISVLASGEKKGAFTRHQVLVNTSLLLLAGHETTINLICNGTLSFIQHPDQW